MFFIDRYFVVASCKQVSTRDVYYVNLRGRVHEESDCGSFKKNVVYKLEKFFRRIVRVRRQLPYYISNRAVHWTTVPYVLFDGEILLLQYNRVERFISVNGSKGQTNGRTKDKGLRMCAIGRFPHSYRRRRR